VGSVRRSLKLFFLIMTISSAYQMINRQISGGPNCDRGKFAELIWSPNSHASIPTALDRRDDTRWP
jgi:hypothetical protein